MRIFFILKKEKCLSVERHFVSLEGELSTMCVFHNTLFRYFPFTLFNIIAFIMLFFTFRKTDFDLCPSAFPIKRKGNNGKTITA